MLRNKDRGCWGRWCARLVNKNKKLEFENKRLKDRIIELKKRPDFTKSGHDVSEFYNLEPDV
jgi:regulator of replication initiation timing